MTDICNTDDIIDVRDVIARVEELEGVLYTTDDVFPASDMEELTALKALLEACKGNGGDEQWMGDWYPVTLIHDSYFKDYAKDLADDCGMVPADASWPMTCIDWTEAARQLRQDYTAIEFGSSTYWTR